VISPNASFMSMAGMEAREMPDAQKSETLAQFKRDLIYIGQHARDPDFSFSAQGTEKIGGINAQILDVNGDGVPCAATSTRKATGAARVLSHGGTVRAGAGRDRSGRLEDQRWFDAPLSAQDQTERRRLQHCAVHHDQINPTVDPKLFDKPVSEAKATQ